MVLISVKILVSLQPKMANGKCGNENDSFPLAFRGGFQGISWARWAWMWGVRVKERSPSS